MSRPRVAIIGSCVSRDNFNSEFSPDYKDKVNLVADAYQSSLPSLARTSPIGLRSAGLMGLYDKVFELEYAGTNLEKLSNSQPDYVLLDGYADIQFGATKRDNLYVTRNHMAFATQEESDEFYDDKNHTGFDRSRFGEEVWYEDLVIDSLHTIFDKIREKSKQVTFVLNPARFALEYKSGSYPRSYPRADRLIAKNERWATLDRMITSLGAVALSYEKIDFIGDKDHKWGLNPVHYQQNFYNEFWNQFDQIID